VQGFERDFCCHVQGGRLRNLGTAALHGIRTFTKLVLLRFKVNLMCSIFMLKPLQPCPVFASYTLAFALKLRKKHGKTSIKRRKPSFRHVKTLIYSAVMN
jgi:hypothetical protein